MPDTRAGTMPRGAMAAYAAAFFGAHLAFMPLLVLLLPRRVEVLAPDSPAQTLSALLLAGGVIAGLAHIAAGHASDRWLARHGNRRGLIALGTVLLAASYGVLALAPGLPALFGAMAFFQIALNCAFAPLGALLADHFPDTIKGRMGGLMNAALPASSLAVVMVGWFFPADGVAGFAVTGALAVACFLPLLCRWNLGPVIARPDTPALPHEAPAPGKRHDFLIAWWARLLVQTGAALVIGYVYIYIVATLAAGTDSPTRSASEILAVLSAPAAVLALFATIAGGALSDARAIRKGPLVLACLTFAAGLGLLWATPGFAGFLIAYALFQSGLSAFLAIDTALVAQLVADQPRRGLLLGVMNLTNTMPAIIVPAVTLAAYRQEELAATLGNLFGLCALAALAAGLMLLRIRTIR